MGRCPERGQADHDGRVTPHREARNRPVSGYWAGAPTRGESDGSCAAVAGWTALVARSAEAEEIDVPELCDSL